MLARFWKGQRAIFSTLSQNSKVMGCEYADLFRFTSGRWLYDEQNQMAKRYVQFDVDALLQIAGQALKSRCVELKKLPEGLSNKVFSLRMANGKEILARIPNPSAGHPYYVVASEVATLDFLRNILGIPVPRIIKWSSRELASSNPVGAEYMLMERMPGRQLSDVWPNMSQAQRFGLVKSVVEIEKKLMGAKFSRYGSIFYRNDRTNDPQAVESTILAAPEGKDTSRFTLGPVVHPVFWIDEKSELDIDRGPWNTAEEYFRAVASCEIAWIKEIGSRRFQSMSPLSRTKLTDPEKHIKLLEQYLSVLPYILPPEKEIDRPILWHEDLHDENIFVDDTDPTKVTGIIDWQAMWAAPLFVQARFPSVFDYEKPYVWGVAIPKLPDDYDSFSKSEQESALTTLSRQRLKKFYEIASRKFNPLVFKALDFTRDMEDPFASLCVVIGQIWPEGPVAIRELLIQIYEKWDWMVKRRGLDLPCPISFTKEEMCEAREEAEAWAVAFSEFQALRTRIAGKDGRVPHEDYDWAMAQFNDYREPLEELQKRVERLGGAKPINFQ
ncbi:MAG: hypothetical protein Q9219_002188 [cf. Caloplaca sp. 3 TL-2023]